MKTYLAQSTPAATTTTPVAGPLSHLNGAGTAGGYQVGQGADLGLINIISTVINAALALTGVIFLALLVSAGYNWMTSGGDSDKVTKAKETITRSIIGLLIVLMSYAISAFVVPTIYCATNPNAIGCQDDYGNTISQPCGGRTGISCAPDGS